MLEVCLPCHLAKQDHDKEERAPICVGANKKHLCYLKFIMETYL